MVRKRYPVASAELAFRGSRGCPDGRWCGGGSDVRVERGQEEIAEICGVVGRGEEGGGGEDV